MSGTVYRFCAPAAGKKSASDVDVQRVADLAARFAARPSPMRVEGEAPDVESLSNKFRYSLQLTDLVADGARKRGREEVGKSAAIRSASASADPNPAKRVARFV